MPSTQLVLFGADASGRELVISDKSPKELEAHLLDGFVGAVLASAVGAVITVLGAMRLLGD